MCSRSVLPGKPQATHQAVCTGEWARRRLIAYVSGTSMVILEGVNEVLQTIDHEQAIIGVTLNEEHGKFAVSSGNQVIIYEPTGLEEGMLRWVFQSSFGLQPGEGMIRSLSWGVDDELLVGSHSLCLWETTKGRVRRLWRRDLANSVKIAIHSYDAALVASVGDYERLVKVWSRLSFGSENVQFDFSYLPHRAAVTALHWRRPVHREETIDNVLYTLCIDGLLRVWAPVQNQDQGQLQLWAAIDLRSCPPIPFTESSRTPLHAQKALEPKFHPIRYAFVVDSKVFTVASELAVQTAGNTEKEMENLQRLAEAASRNPEIVVSFDSKGKMSVLGLENIGSKVRKPTSVFNIVTGEGTDLFMPYDNGNIQFLTFSSPKKGSGGLVVLVHFFGSQIHWYDTRLDELFDPAPHKQRLRLRGIWSGHSSAIKFMTRTTNGRAILSSADGDMPEHYVWTKLRTSRMTTLLKQSSIQPLERVWRAVIMDNGNLVMTLHQRSVILWNTSQFEAVKLAEVSHNLESVLSLLLLPEADDGLHTYHIVSVSEKLNGIAWEVRIPSSTEGKGPTLRQYCTFNMGEIEPQKMFLPTDPVGWTATLSGTLDKFSREVAISVTESGVLTSWSARVLLEDPQIQWLNSFTVPTGIGSPALVRGSSLGKAVLVNSKRNELTIWAVRSEQLEYQNNFGEHDTIRDLDWACTPDSQSILAVGFPHRVLLLCQLRYDYLHHGPAWAPFREIKIRILTPHPIGDSIWMDGGALVIGAGNQLLVQSRKFDITETDVTQLPNVLPHKVEGDDIFDIVSHLNGPVPVYHPQFLQQCILAGKTNLVERILINLYKELRNYRAELGLDNFLGIPLEAFTDPDEEEKLMRKNSISIPSYFDCYEDEDELSSFGEELASKLIELYLKIPIPHLTGSEQMNLAGITECVAQVNKHRRSIDENGVRYLLFLRQYALGGDRAPSAGNGGLSWREITWAFHSDSQEILVDMVAQAHRGRVSWFQARDSGLFMWLRDLESVRNQFEVVARNHYTSAEVKNPVHCSLHYLALRKKNVLLGLWRIAGWHREQAATMRFLSNDFTQPKWKTAAKKNAFVLMGKQRFEYAAAFFLLADALKDAVNVLFDRMNDPQLAIAVARVYEGDDGNVLRYFLEEKILPMAAKSGNRWLATWAYWMLKRKDYAVRALVSPLRTLLPSCSSITDPSNPNSRCASPFVGSSNFDLKARLFLADDPALVILYKQIRNKTTLTLRGAEKIPPATEFEFVLHTARLYDRMGCDLLALDLVKNWEFLIPPEGLLAKVHTAKPLIQINSKRHHIRRRSTISQTSDDMTSFKSFGGPSQVAKAEQPKSILDSFGFQEVDQKKGRAEAPKFSVQSVVGAGLVKPPPAVFEEPDMSWAF